MEYTQSSFTNKTSFKFRSDGLAYMIKDRSGTRSNFVRYGDMALGQQFEIEERMEYFRNLGFIWLLLGGYFSMTAHSINFWIYIGLICLGVYKFISTKYTIIPASPANILIIHDENRGEILDLLSKKIREYFISEYGEINFEKTFEEEKRKYKMLLDSAIIGESQFNEYLAKMESDRQKFRV